MPEEKKTLVEGRRICRGCTPLGVNVNQWFICLYAYLTSFRFKNRKILVYVVCYVFMFFTFGGKVPALYGTFYNEYHGTKQLWFSELDGKDYFYSPIKYVYNTIIF